MKRRFLFLIFFGLGISTIVLVVAIFSLYTRAEEQQRAFFRDEVQRAGAVAVNKIDAVLEGDTAMLVEDDTLPLQRPQYFFQKFLRRTLTDTVAHKRFAVVKAVIDFEHENAIIPLDTIYYDTAYKKASKEFLKASDWEADIDVLQYDEWQKKDIFTMTPMLKNDSILEMLLNEQFLYRIIREALLEQGIAIRFDFAVYNSYSSQFVVAPQQTPSQQMLKSRYIFRLKNNGKFLAPHYLILDFPTERGFYLQRMSTIVLLISIFLLVILLIASWTLYALYRQKKVSEIKNDFINNMTHELKTPIATVSLACQALSDETIMSDMEMKKSYLQIITDETDRLRKMVENVLNAARLQKGQINMDIQKTDMHELIQKVADGISLQVSSKNGEMSLSLNAAERVLYVDADHVRNVVANLVENAIKYSDKAPEIRISTWNDKKYFFVSVKDNGIGISKKNQRHIFEDFYRVSTGNLYSVQGYGLGLSYVKRIVMLHGGSISVNSEEKQGTEFVISLPLKR